MTQGNVRGGSYVQINLPDFQRLALETELKTANNLCYHCGQSGHYIANCPNKNISDQSILNTLASNKYSSVSLISNKCSSEPLVPGTEKCHYCLADCYSSHLKSHQKECVKSVDLSCDLCYTRLRADTLSLWKIHSWTN